MSFLARSSSRLFRSAGAASVRRSFAPAVLLRRGMATKPGTFLFTKDHEYVRVDGEGFGTIGISNHAQEALGDIVYVEFSAESGAKIAKGDTIASVESVKAASSVYSPIDAEVTEVNDSVSSAPESLNQSAEGDAWMLKVKFTNPEQLKGLMDREAYEKFNADNH